MWFLLFACGGTVALEPPPAEPPTHVDETWTDLACPEACAGRVHVWTDDEHVRLLHHEADTDACSHPTDMWLDPDGKELLSVRFEPVSREQADRIQGRIQALKEGLTEDRAIDCPDGG